MQKFIVNQDRDGVIVLQGAVVIVRPNEKSPFCKIVIRDGRDWFFLGSYTSEKKAEQVFRCILGFMAQQSSSLFYMPDDEKCNLQ